MAAMRTIEKIPQMNAGLNQPFLDFYRCAEISVRFVSAADLCAEPGYFRFGRDLICFGRCSSGQSSRFSQNGLVDLLHDVYADASEIGLPFDPGEVINNLRLERYVPASKDGSIARWVRDGYYFVRPILKVPVRRHLQKLFFRGWEKLPFPRWPVDTAVEQLFETLMLLALEAEETDRIPFIWFWPDGAPGCTMLTHDVETAKGADFCSTLMDIDDAFGVKTSFQIVPEERYPVSKDFLDSIRQRGFELNVQDLNHDGHLFRDRETFCVRAPAINRFVEAYHSRGFRSAALYRNPDWLGDLGVSYDLSIPNVAHLEPQRGGCCTIFPYFIGRILELPLTTAQDYSLFHILHDYSLDLWKQQLALIGERHGLASFIVHPDYIVAERPRKVYLGLLKHLALLRDRGETWMALPGEVDTWWRQRAAMQLVRRDGQWVIAGPGSERARVAFAERDREGLKYTISGAQSPPRSV